jgi:hypothetical protein
MEKRVRYDGPELRYVASRIHFQIRAAGELHWLDFCIYFIQV